MAHLGVKYMATMVISETLAAPEACKNYMSTCKFYMVHLGTPTSRLVNFTMLLFTSHPKLTMWTACADNNACTGRFKGQVVGHVLAIVRVANA